MTVTLSPHVQDPRPLTDYFDRIYVINLPERLDRRQAITRQLAQAGIPLTPGKVEIFPAIRPSEAHGFPSSAARGCFLSHFSILQRARQQGLSNVLIIEDDLAIAPRFRREQTNLVQQLQQTDWGFIYFGLPEGFDAKAAPTRLIPYTQDIRTTHFYGVHSQIFDPLIEFLEAIQQRAPGHPEGGPMHVDGALWTFRRTHPEVTTLIAKPSLGWQNSSRSDISPSWFDHIPVVKPLMQAARDSKSWLRSRLAR